MKKLTVLILALILVLGIFAGCAEKEIIAPDAQKLAGLTQYESESGVKVAMDEGFVETEIEGVDCAWVKESVALSCNFETFEAIEELGIKAETEEDYAKKVMKRYGINVRPETDEYGQTYINYYQTIKNMPYSYVSFYFETEEGFICANFTCPTEDLELYEESFHLWATTIEQ